MTLKALLVGINAYPDRPLDGCVNDVIEVERLLREQRRAGPAEIRRLIDGDAGTDAVIDGLRWLTRVEPGEERPRRLFHFSGHGTFLADDSGDEDDGQDECLCPVDHATRGPLRDDALQRLYREASPDTHLLLIMDCCHAGSIQRDPASGVKYRFLRPPRGELQRVRDALRRIRAKRYGLEAVRGNTVLLAACRADQTAADAPFKGVYHGALTYCLLRALAEEPGASYEALVARVGHALEDRGFAQIPQLECSRRNRGRPFLDLDGGAAAAPVEIHAGDAAPAEDKAASAARAQVLSLQAQAAAARGEGRVDDELLAHVRAAGAAADLQRPRLAAALLQRLGRALEAAGRLQDVVGAYESAVRALQSDPARLGETIPWGLAPVPMMKGYHTSGEDGPVVLPSDPLTADLDRAEADPLLGASLLCDVGEAYLAQPQDGPAERAYRAALEELDRLCARERSAPPGEVALRARALNALALILQRRAETHSLREEAEAMARRALGLLGEASPARRGPMTVLAALAADRGQLDAAVQGYGEAITLHHEAGDARAEARALVALGLVHRRRADAAAAREAFSGAAAIAEARCDDEALWRARAGIAWCKEMAGDLDGAIESLRQSIAVVGDRSRTLGTDEGRVSFLHGAASVHDHLVDLCLRRAQAGAGLAADVLDAAEESRAQVLGSLPDPPLPPPPLPSTLLDVQAFSSAADGDAPGLSMDMSMMGQMAISQPIFQRPARPRAEPPPAPLARVVFHVLPDRTAILAVTPEGAAHARVAPIGREALEERVASLRVALGVAGPRRGLRFAHSEDLPPPPPAEPPTAPLAVDEALRALHDLLIAPVIDLVPPAAPLVLEPHGALWLVPFGALRAAGGAFLADRNPLLVAPSARVLEQLRALAPLAEPAAQRALVIGNPTMPELTAADGRGLRLEPLPGAEDEARAIAERFGDRARLLLGADATEGAVVEAMREAAVIHLATHGIADSADPLASLIALAPGPSGEDGVLTARKLMLHALVADVVALSACQTALGRISGEGMIGLGRALIWAGARSVLVSQWSVDDEATLELMDAFYRATLAGADRATALQEAQRELRALSPRFEHPRYWAPFVLIGAER